MDLLQRLHRARNQRSCKPSDHIWYKPQPAPQHSRQNDNPANYEDFRTTCKPATNTTPHLHCHGLMRCSQCEPYNQVNAQTRPLCKKLSVAPIQRTGWPASGLSWEH